MIICSKNAGKVSEEEKFPFVNCRKSVGSSSILCEVRGYWVHKRGSVIKGKLKMSDICISANRQSKGLSRYNIK